MEKRALGKGLGALIPTLDIDQAESKRVMNIPIGKIMPNKYQPRIEFKKEKLDELISSIKEKGVVQPVLVRQSGDHYELIAGERRLRAVQSLGIDVIPALVKDVQDIDMLELSLIENIQREELNPMEEANAYQKFITDFKFTQERIAQSIGKDRSTVANMLRLLSLPRKIQDYISKDSITAGHAKALMPLHTEQDQLRVCNLVVKKALSVRETENLVARRMSGAQVTKRGITRDAQITDIESTLQSILGTRVKIVHGKKRGRILIDYYSESDLNRIIDLIRKEK